MLKSLFVLENKIKNISLTYSFYLFITYLVFYSYQYCTIVSLYSICCICKLYLHDFGQYTCIPLSLPAFKGDLILRDVLSQSRLENTCIHIISLSLALKINLSLAVSPLAIIIRDSISVYIHCADDLVIGRTIGSSYCFGSKQRPKSRIKKIF